MDYGAAAVQRRFCIFAQPREICGKNRRCQFNGHGQRAAPSLLSPGYTVTARKAQRENRLYAERAPAPGKSRRTSQKCVTELRTPWDSKALEAAFTRHVENTHHVQRVARRHRKLCTPENGVAEVRIVIAVIASRGRNPPLGECISRWNCQHAPIFFRLESPWLVRRNVTPAQIHFLRIKSLLHETALSAKQKEARPRRGRKNARTQDRAQALRIVERDIERVIGDGVFSLDSNVGGNRFRQAEEHQCVINEMRRNVE